jgi:succinyl-diaminopimelate desuccinylase
MNTLSAQTLALTQQLIALPSVTPEDANCQQVLGQRLTALGFARQDLPSGPVDFRVSNLWAERQVASSAPTLVFAGHTDVVPTGPLNWWHSPPFEPTVRDGKLYGRGAADMKASLAAMVVACEAFLQQVPQPAFNIAFLLTSDEEGPKNVDGTVVVCRWLQAQNRRLNWCVVGEPTANKRTGDMVKNGRRGSMTGKLTIKGIQGHIAYPHLARNPIHQIAPALAQLVGIEWDAGNAYFPATSFQISNIHAGTGVGNVIPGECVVDFNFRYCTESTPESLQQRLEAVLAQHGLEYKIDWTVSGLPFLTPRGGLVDAAERAIAKTTGLQTELSTTGGTSDGRFIAQVCDEVLELGPPNASIHQVNESIALQDLDDLTAIYLQLLHELQTLALALPQQPPTP